MGEDYNSRSAAVKRIQAAATKSALAKRAEIRSRRSGSSSKSKSKNKTDYGQDRDTAVIHRKDGSTEYYQDGKLTKELDASGKQVVRVAVSKDTSKTGSNRARSPQSSREVVVAKQRAEIEAQQRAVAEQKTRTITAKQEFIEKNQGMTAKEFYENYEVRIREDGGAYSISQKHAPNSDFVGAKPRSSPEQSPMVDLHREPEGFQETKNLQDKALAEGKFIPTSLKKTEEELKEEYFFDLEKKKEIETAGGRFKTLPLAMGSDVWKYNQPKTRAGVFTRGAASVVIGAAKTAKLFSDITSFPSDYISEQISGKQSQNYFLRDVSQGSKGLSNLAVRTVKDSDVQSFAIFAATVAFTAGAGTALSGVGAGLTSAGTKALSTATTIFTYAYPVTVAGRAAFIAKDFDYRDSSRSIKRASFLVAEAAGVFAGYSIAKSASRVQNYQKTSSVVKRNAQTGTETLTEKGSLTYKGKTVRSEFKALTAKDGSTKFNVKYYNQKGKVIYQDSGVAQLDDVLYTMKGSRSGRSYYESQASLKSKSGQSAFASEEGRIGSYYTGKSFSVDGKGFSQGSLRARSLVESSSKGAFRSEIYPSTKSFVKAPIKQSYDVFSDFSGVQYSGTNVKIGRFQQAIGKAAIKSQDPLRIFSETGHRGGAFDFVGGSGARPISGGAVMPKPSIASKPVMPQSIPIGKAGAQLLPTTQGIPVVFSLPAARVESPVLSIIESKAPSKTGSTEQILSELEITTEGQVSTQTIGESLGGSKTKTDTKTNTETSPDVITEIVVDPVVESTVDTVIKPPIVLPIIKPIVPFIPFIPINPLRRKSKSQSAISFDVEVRRGGQFLKANLGAITKKQALDLGANIVDVTAAATFRVVSANTNRSRATMFSSFSIQESKGSFSRKKMKFKKKKKLFFIEKRKHRIDTKGEIDQITRKGLARIKTKGLFA